MAGLLAALSLGIPSLADSIAPGILLPKKNTKSISFSPKGTSDIFLLGIMPQGSSVKKGESVAQADFRILDNSIEDYERAIKSKNLEVLKLRYALDQQKERSALALQKYQTALTRTEEDQKDFLEKRKARMLAEEEERVNKALRHMSYKQEELNQLTKMYKDDQVAEETEEIILKRLKNELGESEFAVQGAKLVAELAKLRNIHRLGEDYATAVKEKQMDLEQARKQADFDLEQKKIALTEAEVSLRRLQNKYNELKADREMASFKAPENGILLYGGYVADKWVAIPVAEKLKPGGKLGTDCPGYSSGLHRYAQGGGNRRHQNNEHADSRRYYGSQPHSGSRRQAPHYHHAQGSRQPDFRARPSRPGDHQGPTGLISFNGLP